MKLAACAVAIIVGGISILASNGIGSELLDVIRSVPGGDTTAHFLLIGIMSLVASLAFVSSDRQRQLQQWCSVVVVLMLLVSLDEFSQLFLPLRTFSFTDLVANYAGVLCFSLVSLIIRRFQAP